MANGQFQGLVADIPGAFQRGLQFQQAGKLRPIELKEAGLGLQRQEQQLVTGGLQQQALQQQIDQRTDEQKNLSLVNSALRLQQVPDSQKLSALLKQEQEILSKGGEPTDTRVGIQLAQEGRFDELNQGLGRIIELGEKQGLIKAQPQQKEAPSFTLSPGQTRFGPGGKVIAEVAQKVAIPTEQAKKIEIPQVLLSGLDPDLAEKGSAAFTAAGGGKDGLTAFQKIVDQGTEQQRRLASPAIIKSSFPKASPAETVQLQAAMDAAKTTETGLKSAVNVRKEQRRTKKAQIFQARAVELLNSILGSDELDDVLGAVEGAIDFRFQDDEAELIADIEEATNILTADNMDLMSGVLSESDIKILKSLSGGALNRKRTESRFRGDVQTIIDKLSSKKVVTIDEQEAIREQSNQLQEGQVIRNPTTGERMKVVNGQLVSI